MMFPDTSAVFARNICRNTYLEKFFPNRAKNIRSVGPNAPVLHELTNQI